METFTKNWTPGVPKLEIIFTIDGVYYVLEGTRDDTTL